MISHQVTSEIYFENTVNRAYGKSIQLLIDENVSHYECRMCCTWASLEDVAWNGQDCKECGDPMLEIKTGERS
jgi:Zn finger protein HypA/HybF involved in hydrogenase expression